MERQRTAICQSQKLNSESSLLPLRACISRGLESWAGVGTLIWDMGILKTRPSTCPCFSIFAYWRGVSYNERNNPTAETLRKHLTQYGSALWWPWRTGVEAGGFPSLPRKLDWPLPASCSFPAQSTHHRPDMQILSAASSEGADECQINFFCPSATWSLPAVSVGMASPRTLCFSRWTVPQHSSLGHLSSSVHCCLGGWVNIWILCQSEGLC